MLTDFQKEKISHYFRVVLDQNKNGILEEEDFKRIGESLCVIWGYKPGTPEHGKVIDDNLASWKVFKAYFEGRNAVASEEQFIHFYEKMLAPGGKKLYERFVLRLDRDGDGHITRKDLLRAVNEFFRSNDKQSPGNWLFGFWGERD